MIELFNRFNVKTNSYEFTTGSSGMIISSSDMQALIASCKTSPLVLSFLYAKQQFGDTEHSLKDFEIKLRPFMYNRLIAQSPSIETHILTKYHISIIDALDDITECVFKYLTRHKIKDDNIRLYMPNGVKKDTFRRHYAKFMKKTISELEIMLNDLLRQIIDKIYEKF